MSEVIQPNFIGLGVQKGGTSWLYRQFVNHPQIFVPKSRKEIHFFDEYFDKGGDWYLKWFEGAQSHKAIGEITPNYIYDEKVAKRIKQYLPDMKFIVMLRHPVRRAYSHYQMLFQSGEGQKYKSFDDFMKRHPHGFKRGVYGEQIERWFQDFRPEQFLFLISEEVFEQPKEAFEHIGKFLSVEAAHFDVEAATQKVGAARQAPVSSGLSRLAQKTRLWLRDHDLDAVAELLKKIGITRQLFGTQKVQIPSFTEAELAHWKKKYDLDIKKLESLLGRSFDLWRE
ncbi:MAG: sulfotransferase [Alphaproteobacteria bacterium]|nr:sulfotransferase [Alphaproteobacteria bacterium]